MSVNTEIAQLQLNLDNSYSAVSDNGGVLPQQLNFDNLSTAINSITTEAMAELDEINGENV